MTNSESINRAPLQISWKNFDGSEELICEIESELERLEKLCPVHRCQTTVEAVMKDSYQVTVLLELRGVLRLARARGSNPLAAVKEAFAQSREHLAQRGMRESIDLWGLLGPLSVSGRGALNT
jgi:hypothetical protein